MDPKSMPAFPASYYTDDGEWAKRDGMTLRDYFAAKAIQGATTGDGGLPDPSYCQLIATRAYLLADAMLKARQP